MLAAETRVAPLPNSVVLPARFPIAWRQIVQPLEAFVGAVSQRMAEQINAFEPDLACYAQYALTAQGKQLRPVLVGLSGCATGTLQDSHISVAVIIEMVHLATLVHDDVMDEATLRRGRPTLAANWGNELSVLLGDCLFARALELAASFPTPEVCRAVSSATNTVCAGEILQTQRRGQFNLTRAEYLKVLAMKTGELFALACDLGGHLSGATPKQRRALRDYGLKLGTAYQIYDDCLDLFGSEDAAGKSLGTDLAKGKATLPILGILERADAAADQLQAMLRDWQPELLPRLLGILQSNGSLNESLRVIHEHLESARRLAATLPAAEGCAGLIGLCEVLAAQTESLGGAV